MESHSTPPLARMGSAGNLRQQMQRRGSSPLLNSSMRSEMDSSRGGTASSGADGESSDKTPIQGSSSVSPSEMNDIGGMPGRVRSLQGGRRGPGGRFQRRTGSMDSLGSEGSGDDDGVGPIMGRRRSQTTVSRDSGPSPAPLQSQLSAGGNSGGSGGGGSGGVGVNLNRRDSLGAGAQPMMILEELKRAGLVDVEKDPVGATRKVQEVRAKRLGLEGAGDKGMGSSNNSPMGGGGGGGGGGGRKQSSWDLLRLHRSLGLDFNSRRSTAAARAMSLRPRESVHRSLSRSTSRDRGGGGGMGEDHEAMAAAAVAALQNNMSQHSTGSMRGRFRWDDDDLTIEQLISNQNKERKKQGRGNHKIYTARTRIETALWQDDYLLQLYGLQLTSLPDDIGQVTSVQVLDVSCNSLGKLNPEVGNLTALTVLDANCNQLTSLPTEQLGALTNLTKVNLSMNRLLSVPESIGELKLLKQLDVSRNLLIELPDELCNCVSLVRLDVWANHLTRLPEDMGRLVNLKTLKASENKLSQLPLTLAGMASLRTLHLHQNQLTALPPEITELSVLETLTLQGNANLISPPLMELYPVDQIPDEYDDFNRVAEVSEFFRHLLPTVVRTRTNLFGALKDKKYTDLVVVVEGQRVEAHKVILSQRCTKLRSMIQQLDDQGKAFNFKMNARKEELALHDLTYPVFMALLEYMYTDNVVSDLDNAGKLGAAAADYKMERLRQLCGKFVEPFKDVSAEELAEASANEGSGVAGVASMAAAASGRLGAASRMTTSSSGTMGGSQHMRPVPYPSRMESVYGTHGAGPGTGDVDEQQQGGSSNSNSNGGIGGGSTVASKPQRERHPYDTAPRYAFFLDGFHGLYKGSQDLDLTHDLEKIFNFKAFSDVVFEIEGRLVHAHKIILVSRCEHFHVVFRLHAEATGTVGESSSSSSSLASSKTGPELIQVLDYSYAAFEKLLRYVYCGRVELDSSVALELLTAAHEYELDTLKEECERFLAKQLTRESVLENLKIAYVHEAPQLLDYCFHYVLACYEDLSMEELFQELPRPVLKRLERRRQPQRVPDKFPWEKVTRRQRPRSSAAEGRYSRMSQRSDRTMRDLAIYRQEFRTSHASLYDTLHSEDGVGGGGVGSGSSGGGGGGGGGGGSGIGSGQRSAFSAHGGGGGGGGAGVGSGDDDARSLDGQDVADDIGDDSDQER